MLKSPSNGENETHMVDMTDKTGSVDNSGNISYLLLQSRLFDDKVYESIKSNGDIISIKDLVKAFKEDENALEKLIKSAIKDRGDLFNDKVDNRGKIQHTKTTDYNEKMERAPTFAEIASKNTRHIKPSRKLISMNTSDMGDFLSGKLKNHKIMVRNTDQVIRYFKFPSAGKRSIAQIKSFIMSLNIRLDEIINIEIVNDEMIEVTILKLNSDLIIGKIQLHLELSHSRPEEILITDDNKKIESLLPDSIIDYRSHLLFIKEKLDKLDIKFRYRRFLTAMLNKIDTTLQAIFKEEEAHDEAYKMKVEMDQNNGHFETNY